MTASPMTGAAQAVRAAARPLREAQDYDRLAQRLGEAQLVLLGEASHGTHEFYRSRAALTQRLIEEHGFEAVAVEADWPDAYRVNRYVQLRSEDRDAAAALGDFRRFPSWMWRNAEVLEFVRWLRARNEGCAPQRRAGFFGLDLYSLHASAAAVIRALERLDPAAAERARQRYACFEQFEQDPQAYGYAARFDLDRSCEDAVVEQLVELRREAADYLARDGRETEDAVFHAEQNARVVQNAERYYRSMFGARVSSWNLRDTHMSETLDALVAHLQRGGKRGRVVVWEHNSHLGDARATELGEQGELNVGQLVRQRYGERAALVGFTTYKGTVTAASEWEAPAERKSVRPALPESYEALFHAAGIERFALDLKERSEAVDALAAERLERAIGVVYLPRTERASHYFHARLPAQFDLVLHFDFSRAVEPLEPTSIWERGEAPETFPTGM